MVNGLGGLGGMKGMGCASVADASARGGVEKKCKLLKDLGLKVCVPA